MNRELFVCVRCVSDRYDRGDWKSTHHNSFVRRHDGLLKSVGVCWIEEEVGGDVPY